MAAGGLSDVFSKILDKEINLKANESVILHKAKSDQQRKQAASRREEEEDEDEDEVSDEVAVKAKKRKLTADIDALMKGSYRERQTGRLQWLREAFCGDDASMRQHGVREKRLRQQATRAAVQLFNAVREHQTDVRASLQESGTTEAKRARIEKKHASSLGFLERLEKKKREEPEEAESKDKWRKMLDPEFAMGSTMKSWDQESSEDSG